MDDPIYKEAVFYVMSGTGNTYRVVRWIEEIVKQGSIKTKVVLIEDADFDNDLKKGPESRLGLLFPPHGFMPPWSMIKFLFRLPKRMGMPAFCLATRGALKMGTLQIPGAAGFATFFAALIMVLKGYRIRAIFSLDMPTNFIHFHWGLHPKNVDNISDSARSRLKLLVPRILNAREFCSPAITSANKD